MGFEAFCKQTFEHLERNLNDRNDAAFWSASHAVPHLLVTESSPRNGIWCAEGKVGSASEKAGISLMLVPGELRVGVIIPKRLMPESDDATVALSPDGQPHDAVREILGGYALLYDRSYQAEPFSAAWVVEAYGNSDKAEAVALVMSTIVASTWKAAVNVIGEAGGLDLTHNVALVSKEPLPIAAIKRGLPVLIQSTAFTELTGHMLLCRSRLSVDEMAQLVKELGFANIQVVNYEDSSGASTPARALAHT